MEFKNKVVIVTGGAQGIGKTIAEEFQKQGALVCSIDKQPGVYFTGDLAQQDTLEKFAQKVITEYCHVDYLINNALPLMKGIDNCSYEEFNYADKGSLLLKFLCNSLSNALRTSRYNHYFIIKLHIKPSPKSRFLFLLPQHCIFFFTSSTIESFALDIEPFSLIKRESSGILLVYV